ncbi:hypothetical protein OGAPHI_001230 [Ogataea philodendri]|uniref:PCI domain-containing protein n=1 Tax=Ogataea philodendri TaxID=1378263 RepID=A0A9P8T9V9_9ASCO|nr:uncharacterized protein OGAPHI_001230 [Ogataea philodendri]KAH3670715.1 hypothetical protein OGAPHI_001230 [Ogataea philodendri]
MDSDPLTVLITLREEIESAENAELVGVMYQLEDFYERKLWFQLTELLSQQFYKNPNSQPIRLKLFENFILKFNDKINQLKLIEFLLLSIQESELPESLEYLLNLKQLIKNRKNIKKTDDDDIADIDILQALLFLEIEIAGVKLKLGFVDEASAIIDECSKKIETINWSLDNRINASYYFTNASLMKLKGDYTAVYYNSLLFLACIDDLENLTNKQEIVRDISVSALLGDKIYNFGEIIMHDIFKYLTIPWLKQLLLSLNSGDLKSFESVVTGKEIQQVAELASNVNFLKQKMCIMSLIELIFNRPTKNRVFKYDDIRAHVPFLKDHNEVENLIIKCFSLQLIKGLINEVDSEVEVTWIQPRTMTVEQIQAMKGQLETWTSKVADLNEYMAVSGKELWV